MIRIHPLLFGAALAALVIPAARAQQRPAPTFGALARPMPATERGFKRIFDGKSLEGWKQSGPGRLSLLSDGSILTEGGMGMLWYAREPYKDFILKVDWKAQRPEANAGVFVRFPDPGDDPWVAVNKGYELQINDSADALHRTGAVYTFAPSTFTPTRPYGAWNTMEIRVVGQQYTVKVNGRQVSQYTGDRTLEGYIGVQNHGDSDKVYFRNIRVKKLGK